MDILDDEILNLWRLLDKHQVLYIMVGGFASNLHGFQRTTSDIDIWIKDSPENRKKLRMVLNELEIGDYESIETTQFVPGFTSIMLKSGIELDIMTYLKGFDQLRFDECFSTASVAEVENVPIRFLHITQLIQAKQASGRPKDLVDLEELIRIRDLNSKA